MLYSMQFAKYNMFLHFIVVFYKYRLIKVH